ncbi:IclR family transcriptional regulator [Methylobacterium oryzihabitans]|uniref:IclR family transcriptional regulator n=1 Tax=Methylobacterium oryzihabitans TaxID=2499852 RepID=A0A3S2VPD2_9HYPH|nr:IclR family transcriptional regulator C-terminal domain-containing protein [Methylobacterium oryzihabitans]RVU13782.1 IclR family transcriptional regulator [Methylobacterium oryzihabitans]
MPRKIVNRASAGSLPESAAPTADSAEEAAGAGPLDRYMAVLELVAAFPDAITMSDVCTLLDLPKTTAHRLLAGLLRAGLVQGGGRHRTYSLGTRLVRLLHASAEDGWIVALARPALEALTAERGETCYLTRLMGPAVRVVFSVSPEVQWRSYVQPGLEMPPHAAATAKAILAFQEPALIGKALERDLPALTSQTRTARDAVLRDYDEVRAKGYGTCISEIDEGLGALGVPVRLDDGPVLYSVGLTGPVQRVFNDDLPARLAGLERAAATLGRALSHGSRIARRG